MAYAANRSEERKFRNDFTIITRSQDSEADMESKSSSDAQIYSPTT